MNVSLHNTCCVGIGLMYPLEHKVFWNIVCLCVWGVFLEPKRFKGFYLHLVLTTIYIP